MNKKILLVIGLLSANFCGFTQSLPADWRQGTCYSGNFYDRDTFSTSIRYIRDTTLCGTTYAIICRTHSTIGATPACNAYTYIRMAGGKVYSGGNCSYPDQLMYDFNLNVNDTITINHTIFYSGQYKVDSIYNISLLNGATRKYMVLTGNTAPNKGATIRWIEGIGDIDWGFFPAGDFEGGHSTFICHKESGQTLWINSKTNLANCDSITPVSFPNITATISTKSITCSGGCNTTATANTSGAGPLTYSWNPGGETTRSITGLCAGDYTVTVKDGIGATASASVSIVPYTPLTVSCFASPDTIAYGSTSTLSASPSGGSQAYGYSWSFGYSGPTHPVMSPGSTTCYSVLITDSQGCTATCETCVTVTSTSAIDEIGSKISVKIFPIPASDRMIVEAEESKILTMRLINPVGQKIAEIKFHKRIEIDVSSYGKGIFLIEVCDEKQIKFWRKVLVE